MTEPDQTVSQGRHSDSDATPTYRGYRRQSLYALYRLFHDGLAEGVTLQPEGIEDLAIFDAHGVLIEVVQVKSRSEPLTRSDLGAAYFRRMAVHCDPASAVRVTVASFGPIGPELKASTGSTGTSQQSRSRHRRAGRGGKSSDVDASAELDHRVLRHVSLEEVADEDLTAQVIEALRRSAAGVDPVHAFDFLMWWIWTSSEARQRISREQALAKLAGLGRFHAGRAAFYDVWHTDVVPLDDEAVPESEAERLREEFYRGGRVGYAHILAGIDVPRERLLAAIHERLRTGRVVVVHSASGQGKSTLAYRYLMEAAAIGFRVEVRSAIDAQHARRLALAIGGQAEALRVPTLVYVDVRPGDSHWVEVVRALVGSPADTEGLIRVLITIREEDWRRANVAPTDFLFEEVVLEFDETEARAIYGALAELGHATEHLDFDEAWERFGPRKTLFEFVYYVTHDETLAARLSVQVRSLQERVQTAEVAVEELAFLRVASAASAYEARLDARRLADACGVRDPIRTLRHFEDEYLLRCAEGGRLVEGFHAIRSEILADCLHDDALMPWAESAAKALPLMVEEDLESFLLYAFSRRNESAQALVAALDDLRPQTWAGLCGVLRAVMWLGLRGYADENADLIEEVQAELPGGWWMMLDWDLGRAGAGDGLIGLDALHSLSPGTAERARQLRGRQTDKARALVRAAEWLEGRADPPAAPASAQNWSALAETAFWLGHLGISGPLVQAIDAPLISRGVTELPLYQAGEFLRGIREAAPSVYECWWAENRDELLARVRRETGCVRLDVSDESVEAHYLVDLERSDEVRLVELSMERLKLFSNIIPGEPAWRIQGHGHHSSLVPLDFDDTVKAGDDRRGLLPTWSPWLNHLAIGLVNRRLRPATWAEFFAAMADLRASLLGRLSDLREVLASLRGGRTGVFLSDPTTWDACREHLSAGLLFPRAAVDEWGFVDDRPQTLDGVPQPAQRFSSLRRFQPLRAALDGYCRSWSNFLQQAAESLVDVQLGNQENTVRLSVFNGRDARAALVKLHEACRAIDLPAAHPASNFEEREVREVTETSEAWCAFVLRRPGERASRTASRERPLKDALDLTRRRLRAELHGLEKFGGRARILTESVSWDGKRGLWLAVDVDHPFHTLTVLPHVWSCLHRALSKDCPEPIPTSAIDLAWEEVVVVPLVQGRSLGRDACRQFKGAMWSDDDALEREPWRLFAEPVPMEVWNQLRLECWPVDGRIAALDDLVSSYGVLFGHVDHMADLTDLADELDELGTGILKGYLGQEVARLEPWLQRTLETFASVIGICEHTEEWQEHLDVAAAAQILVEPAPCLAPHSEGFPAVLSLDDVVAWRDRLSDWLGRLNVARLLLVADWLGLPALAGSTDEP